MSPRGLRGLTPFLRYACTYPPPEPLMVALARGPLAGYGARTGSLWRLEGDGLVALARFGATVDEADRYARIPLALQVDVSEAVASHRTVIGPAREVGGTRVGAIDGDFWNALVDRVEGVSLVSAPLVLDGEAVGAFGFMTDTQWPDDEESRGFLEVLAAVLALWLTHPLSPIPAPGSRLGQDRWALALTERQAEVMRRVALGERNREIALALGLSESTVKQEVQRVMRTMRTSDRLIAAERARALRLMQP